MCSDTHLHRLTAAALVSALALSACGKKGDPLPPLRVVPTQTQDLAYVQRGDVIHLRLGYPTTTIGGTALPGIDAVEVWHLSRPIEDPDRIPEVSAQEVGTLGTRLLTLRGAELQSATQGGEIVLRLPLEAEEDDALHAFGVRTIATEGEPSELSNLVTVVPKSAPVPPGRIMVEPGPEGVRLAWDVPEGEAEGFHVYRRQAFERGYGDPLAFVEGQGSYLDEAARFGDRYIYTVTTVATREPRRESAFGLEREVRFEDRFPPAPPVELLALPETGLVRLVWKPSPSPDVVGYLVHRADATGEFRTLFEAPVAGLEYRDSGLVGGLTYRYRVTALDGEGNESPPSETVEARPR